MNNYITEVGTLEVNGGNSSTLTIPNGRFFFYFVEYEGSGDISGSGMIYRFWSATSSSPTFAPQKEPSGLSLSLSGNTLTGTAISGVGYYRLRLFGVQS